jgi:hypothetical protein
VKADAEAHGRASARGIELGEIAQDGFGAGQRAVGVVFPHAWCAKRRHHTVAQILIERAVMREDLACSDAVDVAQEREDVVRRTAFCKLGKTDDVGTHDGDVLAPPGAQWFVIVGEFGHDIGREETREVAAGAFRRRTIVDELTHAPDEHGECRRNQHKKECGLGVDAQIDSVVVGEHCVALVNRHGQQRLDIIEDVRLGQLHHPQNADPPGK